MNYMKVGVQGTPDDMDKAAQLLSKEFDIVGETVFPIDDRTDTWLKQPSAGEDNKAITRKI